MVRTFVFRFNKPEVCSRAELFSSLFKLGIDLSGTRLDKFKSLSDTTIVSGAFSTRTPMYFSYLKEKHELLLKESTESQRNVTLNQIMSLQPSSLVVRCPTLTFPVAISHQHFDSTISSIDQRCPPYRFCLFLFFRNCQSSYSSFRFVYLV